MSGSPSGGHRAGERELSQADWLCRAGQGPVRALTGANLPTIRLEPYENRKQKQLTLSTTGRKTQGDPMLKEIARKPESYENEPLVLALMPALLEQYGFSAVATKRGGAMKFVDATAADGTDVRFWLKQGGRTSPTTRPSSSRCSKSLAPRHPRGRGRLRRKAGRTRGRIAVTAKMLTESQAAKEMLRLLPGLHRQPERRPASRRRSKPSAPRLRPAPCA